MLKIVYFFKLLLAFHIFSFRTITVQFIKCHHAHRREYIEFKSKNKHGSF